MDERERKIGRQEGLRVAKKEIRKERMEIKRKI